MKKLWLVGMVAVACTSAFAQSVIYKHVDGNGRVTYSNKPMKDATVVELEPLTLIPSTPEGRLQPQGLSNAAPASPIAPVRSLGSAETKPEFKPAVAIVTALPASSASSTAFAKVETSLQKRRDEERRKILEDELDREEQMLAGVRKNIAEEQQNPELVAAVRLAQNAADPTPTQQLDLRQKLDKASGRIRGLQATVAEHEKNIEALKKELGALKP